MTGNEPEETSHKPVRVNALCAFPRDRHRRRDLPHTSSETSSQARWPGTDLLVETGAEYGRLIGFVSIDMLESLFSSSGMAVPRLEGTSSDARHSWLILSSLADVNWITSQRSTFIIRPSSETITLRNLSRLIVVGNASASRVMIDSRASCILILRSSERDCAVSDIVTTRGERFAGQPGHFGVWPD